MSTAKEIWSEYRLIPGPEVAVSAFFPAMEADAISHGGNFILALNTDAALGRQHFKHIIENCGGRGNGVACKKMQPVAMAPDNGLIANVKHHAISSIERMNREKNAKI